MADVHNPRSPVSRHRRRLIVSVVAIVTLALTMGLAASAIAYERGGPNIVTKNPTVGKRGLYTIQDGDTLWDLCDLFFGEPWYWPTLWSYNPQITNPHWVWPGDVLQMREPQPPARTTLVWSESRYSKRKQDLEILSRYVGYLPDRPFKRSGEIRFAREEHRTLGEYDEVYIEFGVDTDVKVGDNWTIYRYEGEVEHPLTDEFVGHKIRHLGVVRVLDADQRMVKALILKSYQEIYRGDLVTSFFPHSWLVGPVTNQKELIGSIIDFDDPITMVGQYQYVYVDRGRNDGIKRGNRFIIQRRGDGLWYDEPPYDEDDEVDPDVEVGDDPVGADFPWEHIGEVMIVEAFEGTSIGIVSGTNKELVRGDRLFAPKDY